MNEIVKKIKCANCGTESTFSMSSEFELQELMIYAKCSNCGSSIQINFSIIGKNDRRQQNLVESQTEQNKKEGPVINIEDNLFNQDIFTKDNDIKDIIDG